MAKLLIKDVQQKTTKSGKPYLAVKSSNDKFYTIWSENQYLWHLFTPGAELDVMVSTNGKFTTITGVVGEPDKSGGVVVAKQGMPDVWEKLFQKLDRIEKKLDAKMADYELEPLPPLTDKTEIKPQDLPF